MLPQEKFSRRKFSGGRRPHIAMAGKFLSGRRPQTPMAGKFFSGQRSQTMIPGKFFELPKSAECDARKIKEKTFERPNAADSDGKKFFSGQRSHTTSDQRSQIPMAGNVSITTIDYSVRKCFRHNRSTQDI